MKMTIGRKLGALTVLLLAILFILGVAAYARVQQIQSSLGNIVNNKQVQNSASHEMGIEVNRAGVALLGYLLNRNPEHLTHLENAIAQFGMFYKQYDDLCENETDRRLGVKVRKEFDKAAAIANAITRGKKRQMAAIDQLQKDFEDMHGILNDKIQSTLKTTANTNPEKLVASMEMEIHLTDILRELSNFLQTRNDLYLDRIGLHRENFVTNFAAYRSSGLSAEEQQWAETLETTFASNTHTMDKILSIEKENEQALAEFMNLQHTIQETLAQDIQTLTEDDLKRAETSSNRIVKMTVAMVLGLTLAGIFLGGAASYRISRSISMPIGGLSKWADRIASGDLADKQVDITKDEIGDLSRCFKNMVSNLRSFTEQNTLAVQNINSTSAEILAAIQQQASSMKEQAAAVQQTSTTMEEINETGNQISEKAKQVAQAAETTSAAGAAGIDAVDGTRAIMESIKQQVEQVAENIVALSEKTQAIGEIITTVNDIAEQSNLLALNAAIEAVGAGAQGQRFTVVAGEIKTLAEQAKDATAQVRRILGEIQTGINASVMSTEEAVKRVEVGRSKSQVLSDTIKQFTDTTQESVHAFQQIVAGTGQQQIGLDQVSQALKDIRTSTEQTASGIDQIETAVANLSDLSRQLKDMAERA